MKTILYGLFATIALASNLAAADIPTSGVFGILNIIKNNSKEANACLVKALNSTDHQLLIAGGAHVEAAKLDYNNDRERGPSAVGLRYKLLDGSTFDNLSKCD